MVKKIFPILILVLLALPTVLPLFSRGFFSIHDDQQIVRLFELDKALRAGEFPVRWVPDLGFGFGYPLFNFYPPLVYYFGEIFHLLGASFLDATKLVWGLAIVGSAMTMYFLAKEFFGKIGGVVAAIFYLYVPYHAVDAYVRGALAELFSFVWLPLVLLFSYQKRIILTGVTLALLMLTHNLIFLPFVGFFAIWSLIFNRSFFSLLSSLLICFSLTAFFWLPSLAEKQFTLVDQFLTTSLASYKIHFLCLRQLWDSLWGFTGSVSGCVDGMSFRLGKPHVLVSVAAFVLAAILFLRKRVPKSTFHLLSSIFALLLLAVFMTTQYSQLIWDAFQPLWYLQFPWRFLEFAVLFSSLLAGAVFLLIKKPITKAVTAFVLALLVIYLHGKLFRPQTYNLEASDATLLSDQEVKWRVSQTSFEYLPKGIAVKPTQQGSYRLDIPSYPTQKFQVLSGDISTRDVKFGPSNFTLWASSMTGGTIQFSVVNFPGWKVWVDDKPAQISDDNKLKLITVAVPAGDRQIRGKFTNTPIRSFGNLTSLLALVVVSLAVVYATRRNQT